MGVDLNLYDSGASNILEECLVIIIPKFALVDLWVLMKKQLILFQRMLNQALGVAFSYDEAKEKAANVQTTTGSVVIPMSCRWSRRMVE